MRTFLSVRRLGGICLALSLAASGSLWSGPSEACSPMQNVPNVYLAARAFHAGGELLVPKSGGLVFTAHLNLLTEEDARTKVSVEVRSGDALIDGALRHVGRATSGTVTWQWQPTSQTDLPLGNVSVKVTVTNGQTTDDAVVVEDRAVHLPVPRLTLQAARILVGDPAAPMVTCGDESSGGGSCSPGSWKVSTRATAHAEVRVTVAGADADESYFEPHVQVFGAKNGGPGDVVAQGAWGGTSVLTDDFDDHCAQVTALSLVDGTEIVSERICAPDSVDLSAPSASEETAFVKSKLTNCSEAAYPSGTSAANPTGRNGGTDPSDPGSSGSTAGPSGADGGCALAVGAPPSAAKALPFVLFGLVSLFSRMRRSSRAGQR